MEYLYPIIHSSVLVSRKRGAGGGGGIKEFWGGHVPLGPWTFSLPPLSLYQS